MLVQYSAKVHIPSVKKTVVADHFHFFPAIFYLTSSFVTFHPFYFSQSSCQSVDGSGTLRATDCFLWHGFKDCLPIKVSVVKIVFEVRR